MPESIEPTTTTEPTAPEDTSTPATEAGQETTERPAQREARYRLAARAAEAERDALRERLGTYQRAEVAALAGEHLIDGADVLVGTDLAAFLGEDGQVDPAKVKAAAEAAAVGHPHWGRRDRLRRQPGIRPVNFGDPQREDGPGNASWSSALKR